MDVQEILTYVIASLLLLSPAKSDPRPPLQEVVEAKRVEEKIVVVDERDVICLSKNIYFENRGRKCRGSNCCCSCYHKQGATQKISKHCLWRGL